MQNQNMIYIIGAGAIGKALAAFIKCENKNVIILRGSVDNQASQFEKIKVELNDKTIVEADVEISTLSSYSKLDGIVVLTNKSYGNPRISEILKNKINNSPVVILQNGLDIEKVFVENGFPHIYRCVLFATSQPVEGRLRFKPVAISPIGRIKGDTENLIEIVQQLNSQYFEFKTEQNIQPLIWTKAIVNSVFNSVCPLLEIDNGIFHRNKSALSIAKRVIDECIAVAESSGVSLDAEKIMSSLLLISKSSDGQFISTYQDIKNKRKTEIDTLNFAIVNIANGSKKNANVTETKLLGELVRLKSELSQ